MNAVIAALSGFMLLAAGSANAAAPLPSAEDFIKITAVADMFAIQAGKVAQEKGNDALKNFAGLTIKDHAKMSSELQALISSGSVNTEMPKKLDAPHQTKLDELKKASGQEFATAYKSTQIEAHQTAVQLFEHYARDGDNPYLKAWVRKTLPVLRHHVEMAQKL